MNAKKLSESLEFKVTVPFLKVLSIFYNDPKQGFAGSDICAKSKLKSGTVYPLLIRLEENGWLESNWEKVDPKIIGRPKKRLYKVTKHGMQHGTKILSEYIPGAEKLIQLGKNGIPAVC